MIDKKAPLPFDGWSRKHWRTTSPVVWRSINWNEIESCLATGLVTVVSHSHSHTKASLCTSGQLLVEEAQRSRDILRSRIGEENVDTYAYPYGCSRVGSVPVQYVAAVRKAGYQLGLTTNLGLATAECDPYLLPRVQAHAFDVPGVIRAKALGSLKPYSLLEYLRSIKRAV